jgi:hypothetical protein
MPRVVVGGAEKDADLDARVEPDPAERGAMVCAATSSAQR